MHKKGISTSSIENFLSQSAKKFVREPFCFSKKFWYQKFSCIEEKGHNGIVKKVLSHRTETKNSVREPSCFPESFGIEKNLWVGSGVGGLSQFSVENVLSQVAGKF